MKPTLQQSRALALALILSSLGSGCVGTGPNTQNGAVGGAALGALAGAIIGNNSGGGNGLAGAAIGGVVGAVAGGTLGNAEDNRRGTVYTSREAAASDVVVEEAPRAPAPQQEYITVQPSPRAVWIPGFWAYTRSRQYVWVSGHWEIPPARHHHYYPAHWERTHRGYVYVNGYWR